MNHKICNLTLPILGLKICQSDAKEKVEWVYTIKHKIKPGMGPQEPIISDEEGGCWCCCWSSVAWWRGNEVATVGDRFAFINSVSLAITSGKETMMEGRANRRFGGC